MNHIISFITKTVIKDNEVSDNLCLVREMFSDNNRHIRFFLRNFLNPNSNRLYVPLLSSIAAMTVNLEKISSAALLRFMSDVGNCTRRVTRFLIEMENGSFHMPMKIVFPRTLEQKLTNTWPILRVKLVRNHF